LGETSELSADDFRTSGSGHRRAESFCADPHLLPHGISNFGSLWIEGPVLSFCVAGGHDADVNLFDTLAIYSAPKNQAACGRPFLN